MELFEKIFKLMVRNSPPVQAVSLRPDRPPCVLTYGHMVMLEMRSLTAEQLDTFVESLFEPEERRFVESHSQGYAKTHPDYPVVIMAEKFADGYHLTLLHEQAPWDRDSPVDRGSVDPPAPEVQ